MSRLDENIALIRDKIASLSESKARLIIAIDGRCGSGKSTLAAALAEQTGAALLHMDDFFLRPEQRSPERLAKAGENVDHERFFSEVLTPLTRGEDFAYRPWDCGKQAYSEPIAVNASFLTIVEGSYACHPDLWDAYDLRIFLTVDTDTQLNRIAVRNGAGALDEFRNKWIPLEETYFAHYELLSRCDLVLSNE